MYKHSLWKNLDTQKGEIVERSGVLCFCGRQTAGEQVTAAGCQHLDVEERLQAATLIMPQVLEQKMVVNKAASMRFTRGPELKADKAGDRTWAAVMIVAVDPVKLATAFIRSFTRAFLVLLL